MTVSFGNQYSIQMSYGRESAKYNGFSFYSPVPATPALPKNAIVYAMTHVNPDTNSICQLLSKIHTIAVVGLSPNSSRPSFRVAQVLQQAGYHIVPVRPLIDNVLGEQAYPDLQSIPFPIDLVDVFRAPEHVPAIVESCINLGINNLWLQDGVIHDEAASVARLAGINVVMDRCMARDYVQLCKSGEHARIIEAHQPNG